MTLTPAQHEVLEHLRASWIGPDGGPAECVTNLPNRQYAVGMLFPADATAEAYATAGGADPDVLADVLPGELEEADAGVPLAEDWRPSSVAVSFLTDAASAGSESGSESISDRIPSATRRSTPARTRGSRRIAVDER